MNIRRACVEDAEQIAKVHEQTWIETYQPIIEQDDLQQITSFEHRKIMWETALQTNHHVFVLETLHEEIVGFIAGGKARTDYLEVEGEIYNIYVSPDYQGGGYGKELLRTFVEECETIGYQSLLVWILTDNPNGEFYVRLGARPIEAEQITIGKGTYEETAYGWYDLQKLKQLLASSHSKS
ncbi:GNAT family N-acetyltransferase [Alkalibacillus salilacus]|uniref:Ribosomal protein S18 acetylase RimI-like enzyme n=1 Tax=Alkalibacillus salilacus TaxID=284582 RepID=A0ABT9VG07_9BACI|nr:GNAT family N-acetyltransferase [Alkalibacillus salilacus]MDQ0159908.1 ribosomal protein S18 acetylase RimI-like enzyme [Alkalibacillus salilacus]